MQSGNELQEEYLYGLAVRRSFVYIKDNIIYESIRDDLKQTGIVSYEKEDDYVCQKRNRQSENERLIKHIIKKKRCKDFTNLLKGEFCFVAEKITEACKQAQEEPRKDVIRKKPNFVVTDELLQKHLSCLHKELEPREIVDEMFQAGDICDREHDAVTDPDRKYKRVKELLEMVKKKKLHSHFVCALRSLNFVQVLDTLEKDRKIAKKPSEYALRIQQNFRLLKEELPVTRDAKIMVDQMYSFLDDTNISDIYYFTGARRQISKLLKILLLKGKIACKELFRVMEVDLKREDLLSKMVGKSVDLIKRDSPVLDSNLRSLQITCLEEHEDFLLEELEPLDLSDILFEESAIDIPDHDRITESRKISKQVERFLETVKKNENNCFFLFLCALKKNGYSEVLAELAKSCARAKGAESNTKFEWGASHCFTAVASEIVQNRPVNVKLTLEGSTGRQLEQVLHQQVHSTHTWILEEAITHGQMMIEDISTGSVVIQLRPITDQAVQTLLNARENNRLVELILGILKTVNFQSIQTSKPLEVRIQVSYAQSADSRQDISRAELIKERMKAYRNELISELEPKSLISVLAKSDSFAQCAIHSIQNAPTTSECTEKLLSLIENGHPKNIEDFILALKDKGYCEIVELIDPKDNHSKAENIRKAITSNYKEVLDEMQIALARETLSTCIGDVDTIQKKILPKNGKRRQRMSQFLQFILQEDHNVIQFEKMLENNGLENLLKVKEKTHREHINTKGIHVEVKIAEDAARLSGDVLFESLLTLFPTDSSRHLLKDIYHNMSRNIGLGAQAAMNTCADCSEPSVCTCSLCNTKICRHHLITHMDTVHFLADNDSDKTKCSVHSKYFLKTFCRTCRLPLCDVCVTDGGHVFHEKIDLDAILEFFNEVISDENQELISYIRPFYQKILDITNERKKGVPSNYKNVKHEIKQFAESLHKEIESVVQILYAEMDEKEKTETKQLQEQDDIYSLRISKVDETVLQNRQLMSSNNPIELTKFSSSLAYFHVNPSQVKEELPKFSPITNKEEIKEKLFGLFGEFCSM